jgi:hypothetical protein
MKNITDFKAFTQVSENSKQDKFDKALDNLKNQLESDPLYKRANSIKDLKDFSKKIDLLLSKIKSCILSEVKLVIIDDENQISTEKCMKSMDRILKKFTGDDEEMHSYLMTTINDRIINNLELIEYQDKEPEINVDVLMRILRDDIESISGYEMKKNL